MHSLLVILILLALFCMAWQDFKDRAIDWFLFPILLVLLVINSIYKEVFAWNHLLVNIGLLGAQLALLALYFRLRRGNNIFVGEQFLGWGDVLFFAILTTAFSPLNFIVFYIISLVLTLFFFVVLTSMGKKIRHIPLAGSQAIVLILAFLIDIKQWGLYLYNDTFLLNILSHASVHRP